MADWINILLKAFWCGSAAVGFGILFNVAKENLIVVMLGGFIVGLIKFSALKYVSPSIVLASFLAALVMGIYSMIIAQIRHEPLMTYATPSVIPLVPGVFAYRTMFGLIKLSSAAGDEYSRILSDTARNGALTLFIILSFVLGIIIPYQIGKDISRKIVKKGMV
ncbi:MAG: hypothetical protein C5B52_12350 [Bacteroidetes bacterium]|nr:MAG: hypothetical protein C5B52_12350 [Bacteroidota bacterium]